MEQKKALIVPLNWGLGHTTRLVPVIRELISQNVLVYFGGSPEQISMVKNEYPGVLGLSFPVLTVWFGDRKWRFLYFFLQLPGFFLQIYREHRSLKKLVEKEHIDLVISDNAYGLWCDRTYTILITHQLNISLPGSLRFLQTLVSRLIYKIVVKYNECWVPDFEKKPNLTGELSAPPRMPTNVSFIGILSRFDMLALKYMNIAAEKDRVLILLSGPEPQRSHFERLIRKQLQELTLNYHICVVRGLPGKGLTNDPVWINHLPAEALAQLICRSEFIICRSGYSTIMDLVTLNRTALLVPTPGQTEQEYLADYLVERGLFCSIKQMDFQLDRAIDLLKSTCSKNDYSEYRKENFSLNILQNRIRECLIKC